MKDGVLARGKDLGHLEEEEERWNTGERKGVDDKREREGKNVEY